MIPLRGNLNKLVSTSSQFVPSITTLPEIVVTASRIKNDLNSTTNLAYPINVEGDPQQGHYISFYIRVTDPAKLKAFKKVKAAKTLIADSELGIGGGNPNIGPTSTAIAKAKKTLEENKKTSDSKQNSILLQSQPTVRLDTAISLYMPPSVQVSYESKYGDQEIGMLAETGYNAIKGFMTGNSAKAQVMSALEDTGQIVKNMALAAIETAAPGAKALFAIDRGKVITPKMELMFEGIGRRNFTFSFMFIPKSEEEAQVIKDIIYKFKYLMASNYVGGGSAGTREMSFPDKFDIEYMHMGKKNDYLNKIATCALTKMDVEYGGDRYVAYEGGVPQTTKLSLSFTEFEIITKDHIADGY